MTPKTFLSKKNILVLQLLFALLKVKKLTRNQLAKYVRDSLAGCDLKLHFLFVSLAAQCLGVIYFFQSAVCMCVRLRISVCGGMWVCKRVNVLCVGM